MRINKAFNVLIFCIVCNLNAQMQLPNGWKLSPIGQSLNLGDLPLNMEIHPSGKYAAILNAGQSDQSLMLVDLIQHKITDSVPLKATFYGMVFEKSGKYLYVSGGNTNQILKFSLENGKATLSDSIVLGKRWPVKISPVGMDLDAAAETLYVATKEDSSLYAISVTTMKITGKWSLPSAAYDLVIDRKTQLLYVSHWGDASVGVFNLKDKKWKTKIYVGDNPNELLLDSKGGRLFVACADDNTVHIVSLKSLKVTEVLNTALYGTALTGSTPNSLALCAQNNILLIANADNNALAVFSVKNKKASTGLGFIPTGWYPTQVRCVKEEIWVCNGKGFASAANPNGPNPNQKRTQVEYQEGQKTRNKVEYIGGLFRGKLSYFSTTEITDIEKRKKNTATVYANTPFEGENQKNSQIPSGNPIPKMIGDTSPIKYVFYIIKENRTYDQVLSDLPNGDGDTSLLLFGRNVTPNSHKIAEEFVLLDHFYVDAEVSADGHNWSTAAIANDYTEKTWPTSYGGRGGDYVYEGQASIAHPQKGFIWDHCKRAGIGFRTYGEFADDYKANIPVLENQYCKYFTSWDERVKDTSRFYQWKRDFDSLLAIDRVPSLSTIRFINDHTEGVQKDRPTPFAHVADNDLALGMFIDYLSKSSIWDKSVVFVLEDDAQNGPDHIDAHRSIAFVAGGLVKTGFVDHTHYSTSSMLRTMELILGLPPMSQYDASAEPMWRCFSDSAIHNGYFTTPAIIDLNEKNDATNSRSTSMLMNESLKLDLSKEDVADEELMNKVLWQYVKGPNSVVPAPRRAVFIGYTKKEND